MQAVEIEAENQRSYERLMVALEASQGKLDLLIAVCDDRNLQEALMRQYIAELQQQGIAHYRVIVQQQDPSLRQALGQLVQQQPALQQQAPAVVTVQGIDTFLSARLGKVKSEQEQLFGYLQWTREALREFHFPVVIWVNRVLLVQLAEQAPDFWSWRGGVFWFEGKTGAPPLMPEMVSNQAKKIPVDRTQPELTELLLLIEQIEQQDGRDAPPLAALYEQLGQIYAHRMSSDNDRQFAIQAYKRAIQLQRKLGAKAELAESLERLGNLYFELKDNVAPALEAYTEAIGMYREVGESPSETQGARLGEANTLKAIGDVLQFLDRRTEALANYEQAIGMYREVGESPSETQGARLGEANTLKAIGDVLQFLDRRTEALANYEQAIGMYREVGESPSETQGARLGEANTLKAIGDVLQFLNRRTEALANYEQAIGMYREVGDRLGEANTLKAIGDVLQFLDRRTEALANYEQAIGMYREVGARLGEANTLKAIGDVLQFLKRSTEALANYEQAIGMYREVGARLGEANALGGFGDVYFAEANYTQALDAYRQALTLVQQIGDRYSEARFLWYVGKTLAKLDDKWQAVEAYQAALELLQTIGLDELVERCQTAIKDIQQAIAPVPRRAPRLTDEPPTTESYPTVQPIRPRKGTYKSWHWLKRLWRFVRRWFRSGRQ